MEVRLPYVATLMNRLEIEAQAAVVAAERESGDSAMVPDGAWLVDYGRAQRRWAHGPYFDHIDASFVPHRRCSYFERSVEELLACLHRILPTDDHEIVDRAVGNMDRRLRSRWPGMRRRLTRIRVQLEKALSSRQVHSLRRSLRAFTGVAGPEPVPAVILVAARSGSLRLGRREERMLIVEVEPTHTWMRSLATVFHELTHLRVGVSPALVEFESAFANLRASGVLAGNYWNEVVATAFEQLAAAEFDPEFSLSHELYGDPVVDALARALYLDWKEDGPGSIGAGLAHKLSSLSERYWPKSRWRMANLLFRVVVVAEEVEVLQRFRAQGGVHAFWGISPVPVDLRTPPTIPPAVPRLYLLTPAALRDHPILLQSWGLGRKELSTWLARGPVLWRPPHRDGQDYRCIVLWGKSPSALEAAVEQLAFQADRLELPTGEWSPL